MKNKIYTYLLLGIFIAFSMPGFAQTKPVSKHSTIKTNSTSKFHTKSTDKKKPTVNINTKVSNKNLPATKKSTSKNTPVITTKRTLQKKSDTKTISTTKKPTSVSDKKKSVATAKSTTIKNSHVLTKLNNNKQKQHPRDTITALEPSNRKHTIITSKSIKTTPAHSLSIATPQKDNLAIDNAKSNQSLDILSNYPQPTKINTAHVSIETSLFLDGLEADLSKELILQLTEIFAWDIDFATNLRPGDQFSIIYGKKIVDGKETDNDEIIAAEFINQGISYTAVRYVNEEGVSYYTPDGLSMQRAFLTSPVDFIKISSPFDPHRKHPILNRIRAHKGIDYAARTGTPVKTTGDGTITFCGRNGAYGLAVIIQHNDRYETLYAHMSDFKKSLTTGDHVKQGDVIGYVGQTGLATGPHLHYEFHVDGMYRDPETVKLPHSMPISAALLADFKAQTQSYYTQLTQVKAQSLLAKNHSPTIPGLAFPPTSTQSPRYN